MKWAETDVLSSPSSERRVLGSDIDDIGGLPYLVDDLHEVFLEVVDETGQISGSEPVIDIHHSHPSRAGVEHGEKG